MSKNILVVDDEKEIADLIEVYLRENGYTVFKYYDGKGALQCIEEEQVDLALLDVMLPDIDGYKICEQIRRKYNFPVIMLTAKDAEEDKIKGLNIGADDYITKPFRPMEVLARVNAQLRRYINYAPNRFESDKDVLTRSDFQLDIKNHVCKLSGHVLNLTPTEFSILHILLANYGKVVTAEELFNNIWEDEVYTKDNRTITVHIRHMREKMQQASGKSDYIKTVWGVGYKIEE